jgi:peptide/nickel transport system permease protein
VDATPDTPESALTVIPGRRRVRGPGGIPGFILRRVLLGALTLAIVSVVIFAATQALPSDPARARLGKDATPESVAALRDRLGLDRSPVQQYTDWLGGLLHGDLGISLTSDKPVTDDLRGRLKNSAFLVLLSAIISIPLSILLGAYAALKRDGVFDNATAFLSLALAAMPEFVVGLLLVAVFATSVFTVLPAVSIIPPAADPWFDMSKMWLPTLTLVLAVTPYVSRIMRASMVEVLESEYVEMARLKGLPERVVVWRHALPNAIGPTFQVIALNLAYLAGGVVVVESVFSFSGIGVMMRDAVQNRDFVSVQAIGMLIALVYVVTNLIADIATVLVTPRLRTRLR